ncbi:MAG: FAD-dependent oxidoreductase [Deltaproteobacteria bacterium]|nr:FAD-dependent oxidoreductase [Deltaproteobacteria bacterium]
MESYDVIIAGAGPAGIFTALELVEKKEGMKILLIEKGPDIHERKRSGLFSGWGGAGTFSDGKLNLSAEVGGFLNEYLDEDALSSLISHVDSIYLRFGAPEELKGTGFEKVSAIREMAEAAGLRLVSFPIRHMGTDRCLDVLKNMRSALSGRVDLCFMQEVTDVIVEDKRVRAVRTSKGNTLLADFVVLAPGRVGAHWLQTLAARLGLKTGVNQVDIGVRVEVPAAVLAHVTDALHEGKFVLRSRLFNDPVRTFCMNPNGVVVKEAYEGFSTVNGHSYSTKKTDNTNFAILVSTTFTEPFKEPIAYGRYIATLANLLGEGIIVQRLGDLLRGRRSTKKRIDENPLRPTLSEATAGDLSFAVPYRYLTDIIEMLSSLDKVACGVNADSTLLYGVEVKFYSLRLELTRGLETEVKNLFAIGDGAGTTRGIVQASASGIVAAREILARI